MKTPGLKDAPTSSALLLLIIVPTLVASIAGVTDLFYLRISEHIFGLHQYWRLLLWQICFSNSTEMVFASVLAYRLRVVERVLGVKKFSTFVFLSFLYILLLTPSILLLLSPALSSTLDYLPSGLAALLYAILAQYYGSIPPLYRYRATDSPNDTEDFVLTDKFWTYTVAAQLAFSQFPSCLLPAATGWIVGAAYRAGLLPGSAS